MKLKAVAVVVGLVFAQPAWGQVVVGVRVGGGIPFGGGVRFGYQRGPLFVNGGVGSVLVAPPFFGGPIAPARSYFVTSATVVPQFYTVNNFYGGPGPLLGPGFDADIRGVDLDKMPPAKPPRREDPEPPWKPPEGAPAKPLPGVEVSKPVPPFRPGEGGAELKPAPKMPPTPPVPPPAAPGPLADPAEESVRLVDLGQAAFQAGEWGLAAQRFRQATTLTPKNSRTWFLLSQAEFANGKYRDAVAAVHAGMKIDKQWPTLPLQPRLELYRGREVEYAEQMKRLTDAVAGQPNHPTLLFLLAHQLWFDGQRKDAVALFHRARPSAIEPAFIDAFLAAGGGEGGRGAF